MSSKNGSGDPKAAQSRSARPPERQHFSPEVEAYLQARTMRFQAATSGKGRPMSYGCKTESRPKG